MQQQKVNHKHSYESKRKSVKKRWHEIFEPFKEFDVIGMLLHSSACHDGLEDGSINRPQLALRHRCHSPHFQRLAIPAQRQL